MTTGSRVDGKIALITGGGRGQGAATAEALRAAGAEVYLTDIDAEEGAQVGAAIGATFLEHDVTQAQSWDGVVERVLGDHGRLDVLVNNAAIIEWATMTTTSLDTWDRIVAVNQTGPFLGMHAVAPAMKAQRSGSIINISSVGGLGGSSPCFAYGATKWALRGMTRGAAQELGPFGIRVNAVLPGTVESRMIESLDREKLAASIPLRRIALPEEVARLTLWLASDDSAYASGADFVLDGGATA